LNQKDSHYGRRKPKMLLHVERRRELASQDYCEYVDYWLDGKIARWELNHAWAIYEYLSELAKELYELWMQDLDQQQDNLKQDLEAVQ
jgi:hypothetical protein